MAIKLTRACADDGQIWQLSTPNRHALARFMGGWFGGWFTQISHVVRTQWCDFYPTSKWFGEALFWGEIITKICSLKKCFCEPLWMVIKLTRACADGGQIWQLSTPNRHTLARFMGGWFGGWFTQNRARSTHTVVRFLLHFKVVRRCTFFGKK